MTLAEDFWLRSKAAQSSLMQLWAYNTAFTGTATLQAWKMGLSAPAAYWQAMGRVSASGEDLIAPAAPKATAAVKTPRRAKAAAPKAAEAKTPAKAKKPAPKKPAKAAKLADLGPPPHLLKAPRGGKADDLTVLTGVGAKLASSLNEAGIFHFDQLATLDAGGIDRLNEQQAGFKMLCARYNVVEQARARLA